MEGYRLFLDIDFGDFALRYIGCTSINLTPSVPCLNRYNCPYTKGNRFDKKNDAFIRRFTAGVKIIEVDATGRLLIPKNLLGFSGIKKEVVLASAVNIIEIWDKNRYEKAIDDATLDFTDLAEEVMGQDDGNDELS